MIPGPEMRVGSGYRFDSVLSIRRPAFEFKLRCFLTVCLLVILHLLKLSFSICHSVIVRIKLTMNN